MLTDQGRGLTSVTANNFICSPPVARFSYGIFQEQALISPGGPLLFGLDEKETRNSGVNFPRRFLLKRCEKTVAEYMLYTLNFQDEEVGTPHALAPFQLVAHKRENGRKAAHINVYIKLGQTKVEVVFNI